MNRQLIMQTYSLGWHQTKLPEDIDPQPVLHIPGVKFLEDSRRLVVPANAIETVDGLLNAQLVLSKKFESVAPIVGHRGELYPHQVEAVKWLLRQGGGLLADDMGLGKSRASAVAVESFVRAGHGNMLRLIVGPPYVEAVWRRELHALGFIERPEAMAAARTNSPYEKNLLGSLDSGWMFVPYHLVEAWASFCRVSRAGRVGAVIVDEAHWAKNPKSARGAAARHVSTLATFRVLLTGTPMGNRTAELWNLLTALDGEGAWGSYHTFRVRYCGAVHGGHGYVDVGPTNTEELSKRMAPRYMRRTMDTAGIHLPPFRREGFYVPLESSDATGYAKVVADALNGRPMSEVMSALDSGAFSKDTLRWMTKLRKYTSKVKIPETVDLVADAAEQGVSSVVFVWERATAHRIGKLLSARLPAVHVITGEHAQEHRDRTVRSFATAPPGDFGEVLVATLDVLKEGVTLTRATKVIMHDLSWVPSDVLQAEARVWRIGQDKPVTATWMLLRGSFDVILARHLVRKGDEIEKVMGIDAAARASTVFAGETFDKQVVDALSMLTTWARPLETP